MSTFNEDSRVRIPALLYLTQLEKGTETVKRFNCLRPL